MPKRAAVGDFTYDIVVVSGNPSGDRSLWWYGTTQSAQQRRLKTAVTLLVTKVQRMDEIK